MNMDTRIMPWPAFILTLALAFTVFTWWSLTRAAAGVSGVTDPGYYRHGLAYDNTSHELKAADARGWRIAPRLDGRRLTIAVEDGRQAVVPGCLGFIAVQPVAAGQARLPLTDSGRGRYTVDLPAGLPGTFAADLTLTRDQAVLQRRLLIALGP